jgi:hypothetical protein
LREVEQIGGFEHGGKLKETRATAKGNGFAGGIRWTLRRPSPM